MTYIKWYITATPNRELFTQQVASTGTATGAFHGVSDSNHGDMLHNPAILFWEVADSSTAERTQSTDLNIIRENPNDERVAYKMTTSNPFKNYKLSGKASVKALVNDPTAYATVTAFNNNIGAGEKYLHIGVMSKDGGVASSYKFDITIQYFCEFTGITVEEQN